MAEHVRFTVDPGTGQGLASASTADRDDPFAVPVPSGEVQYMSRDIDVGRDVTPDPLGEGGLINPIPWRVPPRRTMNFLFE